MPDPVRAVPSTPLAGLHVLVLAAGKSSRIAPVSGGLPKPLLEFGGKRVIEHALGWLASAGVAEAWVNLHFQPAVIRDALGDGARYGVRLRYSEEPEILGTAGGWRQVALGERATSLVIYGDNVARFDLGRFYDAHRRRRALATVALFDPARHAHTGIAGGTVLLGAEGRIAEFREGRPLSGAGGEYVNAGAYLLEPEVLEHVPPGFQDFGRDVFPRLLATGRLYGHLLEEGGVCLGLDTPESYREGIRLLESGSLRII